MNGNPLKRNNVKVTGSGNRTILFAHGMGCDHRVWNYVYTAFEKDYKVIRFDFIGCGESELESYDKNKYSQLSGYATDILDICDALDLKQVIFVGHGVSCMIGMLASIQNPGMFSSIIMIAPSPSMLNDKNYPGGFDRKELEEILAIMDENYTGWAHLFSPKVMANSDRPLLAEELEERLCSSDPVITRCFAEISFFSDNRADLSKLKTPTLILQCREDLLAPEGVGEYIHQNVTGSELRLMNATGHCPHLSEPEETITLMKAYLSRFDA